MAIENQKDQIPWVYERISRKQDFIGRSECGPVEGFYRKDESSGELQFRVRTSQKPDGSLVLSTDDAIKLLPEMLSKEEFTDAEIERALRKFDEAPENTQITIATGFDIAKSAVMRIDPKLDDRLLLVRLGEGGEEVLQGAGIALLKISFEHLALHVGPDILDCVFDPIRDALRQNDASLSQRRVEWKRGPKLEPFHCLFIDRTPPYVVVQIRLFGELIYRVHFRHLTFGERYPRLQYTHDLLLRDDNFKEVQRTASPSATS